MADTGTGELRLERLRKIFTNQGEQVVAVDDVCLQVEAGEFITLLGPSGCGKTTTLRIVAGLEHASGGHVRLDGQTLNAVPPQKRRMAMVFQSFALFPHLSVRDNIAYGLQVQRYSRRDIDEAVQFALTNMNLVGLGERSPHELSGGQQQRVALARALAVHPAVLLFDEPLSNLDAKLRCSMRAEIRRIQRRLAITSLYVTHDQDEAMSLSDRIVVMNQGRIEQVGHPDDIYLRPASVFVADFVGRANFLEVVPQRVAAGRARVNAFGQELDTACHESVRAGEPAWLVVRPESVTLVPTHDNAEGTILNAVFHGATAEYDIETSTGTLVVSAPRPETMLGEGVNVSVTLDEHRSYVLSKQ
ncbi:MAG: ABC transporter ATP-binding protein [Pseudonocardiaceae bacterium]